MFLSFAIVSVTAFTRKMFISTASDSNKILENIVLSTKPSFSSKSISNFCFCFHAPGSTFTEYSDELREHQIFCLQSSDNQRRHDAVLYQRKNYKWKGLAKEFVEPDRLIWLFRRSWEHERGGEGRQKINVFSDGLQPVLSCSCMRNHNMKLRADI